MNFNHVLIHASAYSKLTTQPKAVADKAAGLLSVTTKTALREIFIEEKYQRRKEITSKQMTKGLLQEEEAITLYCRVSKKLFAKNLIRIENDYITGEPDLTDNEDIMKTEKGVDIKCSWSIFSFPFPDDELSAAYKWQNQCYMFLTGAKFWATAFCLVNAPGHMIKDEKRKLYYSMNCPADNDPEYLLKCVEIEKNMIFNMSEFIAAEENKNFDFDWPVVYPEWTFDVPLTNRVIEFIVERDETLIQSIAPTVEKARAYLNGLADGIY